MRSRRPIAFVVGVFLFGVATSEGIVLIGDETTGNLSAPANGAPWRYVAQLSGFASGVYLGEGFVLTAFHVGQGTSALIDGVTYSIDQSYGQRQLGGADLKLIRIIGNSGLPDLSPLPLFMPGESVFSASATVIGWGFGKGAAVPDQGWDWDRFTAGKRWGTNTTRSDYAYLQSSAYGTQPYLVTDFSRGGGEDEAATAELDSGGALFIQLGGIWKLAGIAVDVSSANRSLFDRNVAMAGDQPDLNYFVPVREYQSEIFATVPEPSVATMLGAGAFLMARRRRPTSAFARQRTAEEWPK